MTADTGPGAAYAEREARFARERDRHAARSARLANARLVAFLGAIAALVWAEAGAPAALPEAFYLAGALLVAFIALVAWQSRAEDRLERTGLLVAGNRDGRARIRRDWDGLPRHQDDQNPADHPYAADLGVDGRASLLRLLGAVATDPGRHTLRDWLLAPAARAEVAARQAAVAELKERTELRQELEVAGRRAGRLERERVERFLEWAEEAPWLRRRPLLLWSARLLPLATIALIMLHAAGVLDRGWWLLALLAAGILTAVHRKRVHRCFHRASAGEANLRRYAELLALLCRTEFASETLVRLRSRLSCAEAHAAAMVAELGWLVELAALRHNGLFWAPIHGITLWDFHVLSRLERWKERAGSRVRDWMDAAAEADALNALGTLAFEEPEWCFPEVDAGADALEADGLAHPLLAGDTRVANDVRVGPPGSFLMVTGSNMSGKTTLLRAIGANAVLAEAGGPVCARRLRMPPATVHTSMRIEDSLEEGVSLFLAELRRLKQVVDAAEAERGAERVVLYLLDEILHGTNSAERQVAVRKVIAHLLDAGAIGAISTHDLELAEAEPLRSAKHAVHFQEIVRPDDERAMSFDYRLRPGVATSTNALKLVALVGLD